MPLIRVEDVELTRQADSLYAAIPERLHAGRGDADCVRVVPVGLERERREVHLDAIDAERVRSDPNRVAARPAGSFKTIQIDAA
jgi:hypothetical protein